MIEEYRAAVTAFIGAQTLADAATHAKAQFPKESCGFVAAGAYVACDNTHKTPERDFTISDPRYDAAVIGKTLQAVIHSHPNGPVRPSEKDMQSQVSTGVPWVIITLNEKGPGESIAWGGNLPIAPVIGRPFVHGVFDCYALIRDVFRKGKDELAKEQVAWPFAPILLPEFPRSDDWWNDGQNLYLDGFEKAGFKEIPRSEAAAGDVFLTAIGNSHINPKKIINHGGVLLQNGELLHHFATQPSRRSIAGPWMRSIQKFVRYEGQPAS